MQLPLWCQSRWPVRASRASVSPQAPPLNRETRRLCRRSLRSPRLQRLRCLLCQPPHPGAARQRPRLRRPRPRCFRPTQRWRRRLACPNRRSEVRSVLRRRRPGAQRMRGASPPCELGQSYRAQFLPGNTRSPRFVSAMATSVQPSPDRSPTATEFSRLPAPNGIS